MLQSLQQKGRKSETLNFAEIYEFVNESNLKNKPELQNLISQFETLVFREEDYTDLNEWMRKFKKLI